MALGELRGVAADARAGAAEISGAPEAELLTGLTDGSIDGSIRSPPRTRVLTPLDGGTETVGDGSGKGGVAETGTLQQGAA